MAVDRVTSSSAAEQAFAQRVSENQQLRAAEREEKPAAPREQQEDASRPVVNTEGQTTGTVINVTA